MCRRFVAGIRGHRESLSKVHIVMDFAVHGVCVCVFQESSLSGGGGGIVVGGWRAIGWLSALHHDHQHLQRRQQQHSGRVRALRKLRNSHLVLFCSGES